MEEYFDYFEEAVDPDDHHLFVSLGCAAENLIQAASAMGFRGRATFAPGKGDSVSIALEPAKSVRSALFEAIPLRQSTRDGDPFAELLKKNGILPGIKVDTGAKNLAGAPGETVTEGLDGLRERLAEYRKLGAVFAKWRAVITIGAGIPSRYCIEANAHALARYAALCQEAGIVPIVEPEVLMDGDHTIVRCYEVTEDTLVTVFTELHRQRVDVERAVLKPSMVISGKSCPQQAGVQQVAAATVRCLKRSVPGLLPGIVFLSGGQSDEVATRNTSQRRTSASSLLKMATSGCHSKGDATVSRA